MWKSHNGQRSGRGAPLYNRVATGGGAAVQRPLHLQRSLEVQRPLEVHQCSGRWKYDGCWMRSDCWRCSNYYGCSGRGRLHGYWRRSGCSRTATPLAAAGGTSAAGSRHKGTRWRRNGRRGDKGTRATTRAQGRSVAAEHRYAQARRHHASASASEAQQDNHGGRRSLVFFTSRCSK